MPPFQRYAAYYDLLYRDKDYEAEARYVAARLRALRPGTRSILEFGSGTGRHGRLLAALGFDVHGIERSAEMVAVAQAHPPGSAGGTFTCKVGDIGELRLGRRFDAVIALFHVVSYQASDAALQAVFAAAAAHLAPGGAFLFDVWHGPAVLGQGVAERVKEAEDDCRRVRRVARPRLDRTRDIVTVTYDMECTDKRGGDIARFSEDHAMRYLFPADIARLAQANGLRVVSSEEFLTGAPPSPATWGVAYMVQKQ